MRSRFLAPVVIAASLLSACGGDGGPTTQARTATSSTTSTAAATSALPLDSTTSTTPTTADLSFLGGATTSTTAATRRPRTIASSGATAAAPTVPAGDPGFPVTVRDSNGPVTVAARPKRIVSLSPTATETLFAVGAGSQVIAVDKSSNHPAEAPRTDLSGFKPNAEAILKFEPDLVVLARGATDVIDSLKRAGVTVLFEAAAVDFADAENQFRDLGAATGHAEAGRQLAASVKQQLAQIAAASPRPTKPISLYWELDPTYYSATSKTFIGKVLSTLGTTNIADAAQAKVDDYPQLSSEHIVASDPDLVLLADTKCCKQTAETVGARAGWADMSAVRNGDVVGLDDDVASRWGPRLPELLRVVAAAVQRVATRR